MSKSPKLAMADPNLALGALPKSENINVNFLSSALSVNIDIFPSSYPAENFCMIHLIWKVVLGTSNFEILCSIYYMIHQMEKSKCLRTNKIVGTPIPKLTIIKRLLVKNIFRNIKVHQKNCQKNLSKKGLPGTPGNPKEPTPSNSKVIHSTYRKTVPFLFAQFQFLEAPLVRQLDGELKNRLLYNNNQGKSNSNIRLRTLK